MQPFRVLNTIISLFAAQALAVDKTVNPELSAKIKSDATRLDVHNDLPDDKSWTFDFNEQPNYTFQPGSVVNANAATFPALTGLGMTMAMLNLGPCAMLPPHLHPRATNVVVAVSGETQTYMVEENGVNMVKTDLKAGQMTVFPRGSLHGMQNMGCDNAVLVSALDSEDTGTLNVFNGVFKNFPKDIVEAALGSQSIDVDGISGAIPDVGTGSVMGSVECVSRCGSQAKNTTAKYIRF